MTDPTWTDYVTADDVSDSADAPDTLDPLAGTAADTDYDASLGVDAADNAYGAATSEDWSNWNAETGDDAVTSAQSYFDAAATAGDPDLAQTWIDDGNAQLDTAADSYSTAASYDDTASSDLSGANSDLGLLGDDADAASATDADSSASADSDADSSYDDSASADTSSYDDSAADS